MNRYLRHWQRLKHGPKRISHRKRHRWHDQKPSWQRQMHQQQP
ncbi:hypothetical protein [Lentilactobacillus parafarraginis]|nr:hypothetical protein [Lentilactobacillus parafarraginis]